MRSSSHFVDLPARLAPVVSNDHELPILQHGHITADRCIHRNDHDQSRCRVTRWEEAAVWPWSSPWPRATTLATSGRPKARPPSVGRAATTLTPPRPGNRPARGWGPGAQALGLTPGQIVQRKPYEAIYQQI